MSSPQRSLNVVLAADRNYLMPLSVAARSVFESIGEATRVEMAILHRGFTASDIAAVRRSTGAAPGQIQFIPFGTVDKAHRASRVHAHISDAAYIRLALDQYVPASWSRCIYLDSDTLTLASIESAHEMLNGKLLAACVDPWTPLLSSPDGVQQWAGLELDPSLPYYNSGVLIIDLDRWRESGATERCFRFLAENRDALVQFDQEILNALFSEDISPLPADWNVLSYWQNENVGRYWSPTRSELDGLSPIDNPRIRHFEGPVKPWTTAPLLWPHVVEYFEVVDRTSFRGWRPAQSERLPSLRLSKAAGTAAQD